MIIFDRAAGTLRIDTYAKPFSTTAWSGHGQYKNKPQFQNLVGLGCIPAGGPGLYRIGPMEPVHGKLGKNVMALVATAETLAAQYAMGIFRSGFFSHGDHPNDWDWSASDGCVIDAYPNRLIISQDRDKLLKVI